MGCDGGTIPRRDELVRTKKKPEQKDKDAELSFRWQHCTISQEALRTPIVACGLGRLYSKDVVIESLLDRSSMPEIAQHIKNLKDIQDLKLTANPAFKPIVGKGDGYVDRQTVPYICPVIGLEMNGKFRFAFLWGCGCVMSERALKEVKTKLCHKCQQPFSEQDVVVLNGNEEDLNLMTVRMEARQARIKAEKKERIDGKRNKKAEATVTKPQATTSSSGDQELPSSSMNGKISKLKGTSLEVSVKVNGKASKRPITGGIQDPLFKKTKDSYSVSKDPGATEIFKSLFTSHKTAQQQDRAHWVTYNPFYN